MRVNELLTNIKNNVPITLRIDDHKARKYTAMQS